MLQGVGAGTLPAGQAMQPCRVSLLACASVQYVTVLPRLYCLQMCEDLEDEEGLAALFNIFKQSEQAQQAQAGDSVAGGPAGSLLKLNVCCTVACHLPPSAAVGASCLQLCC
jgi:hypothetical protein